MAKYSNYRSFGFFLLIVVFGREHAVLLHCYITSSLRKVIIIRYIVLDGLRDGITKWGGHVAEL